MLGLQDSVSDALACPSHSTAIRDCGLDMITKPQSCYQKGCCLDPPRPLRCCDDSPLTPQLSKIVLAEKAVHEHGMSILQYCEIHYRLAREAVASPGSASHRAGILGQHSGTQPVKPMESDLPASAAVLQT